MTVASISMGVSSVQMSSWIHLEKLAPSTGHLAGSYRFFCARLELFVSNRLK